MDQTTLATLPIGTGSEVEPLAARLPSPVADRPSPVDSTAILDWDATIDPPEPAWTPIRVRVEWVDYGPPLPLDDPWAE